MSTSNRRCPRSTGFAAGRGFDKRGAIYNAEQIDTTTEKLTLSVAERGYAFGQIRPRVDRDPIGRTISVVYVIEQGPRVYIERINVVGNARTRDYVVRREIRLAEGDAYNRLLADKRGYSAKAEFLQSLNSIGTGSSPDRVILNFLVKNNHFELSMQVAILQRRRLPRCHTERNLPVRDSSYGSSCRGASRAARSIELTETRSSTEI